MCVYSLVIDKFNPWFEPYIAPQYPYNPPTVIQPVMDLEKLRKLIRDFGVAIEAAKTVDTLTDQPDCEDPEKAKLVDRVKRLEEELGIEN